MTPRRTLLAAALPVAAAVLTGCAATAPPPTAPPAPAAVAAPATPDTAAACAAVLEINAAVPPGIDPDGPPASAAELRAWADGLAAPFAALRDNAPDSLDDSVAAVGGVLDGARRGQPVSADDPASNAAASAINAWVHDSCGYQTLDVVSESGALGPEPAALEPGPVMLSFRSTSDPGAPVLLHSRVRDGPQAHASDVDAGRVDFLAVADVVGTAHPGDDGPAYGTAVLEPGTYLLTSPLGLPPGSAGTTSLDLAVG